MTESKFKKKKLYKRLKTGWMLLPKQKTKNTTNEKKPEQHTLTFWTRAAPSPHKKKKNIPGILGKGKPTKQAQQSPSPCPPPSLTHTAFPLHRLSSFSVSLLTFPSPLFLQMCLMFHII